ncbi:AraC family transcriptional regulator [Microbacterium sp. 18062]|uniref:helix-turn-helix transcriptional regulator n=1 Tax=Microbacterium sp. 18062 TaxID=2681410 RepID=UPI00135B4BF6|nr:helix-turn-helix domain-containing protein [Microbacterium sp. 18062]
MVVDADVVPPGALPPEVSLRRVRMDEAMSVGSLVFHQHVLTPLVRDAEPFLTLHSFRTGAVTLGTVTYSSAVRVQTGSVRDAYQVNIPLDGSLRTMRGDRAITASPRLAAVYGLHRHGFEGLGGPQRILGVKIRREALERRLEQLLGRPARGAAIEFEFGMALEGARARDWYMVLQLLGRRLWGAAGLSADTVVTANLQDTLLTGLLLASRHSFSDELDQPAGPAAPRAVRRAVDAVEAHPDAALMTVPELARTAGVSVRALQAGFRQALETTPLAFLRERRLTHARRDLERAEPPTDSVARIAERWGFAHHGRFALDYRRRFGEHPSQTLRRA